MTTSNGAGAKEARAEAERTKQNLKLWSLLCKTDPAFTKEFKRAGGFQGTSVNAQWLRELLTKVLGPRGHGWQIKIMDEKMEDGAPVYKDGEIIGNEKLHVLRGRLSWEFNGASGYTEQFGTTLFVANSKYGMRTDEECHKKTYTDMFLKCAAELGAAADIHMGQYDDAEYVRERKAEADEERLAERYDVAIRQRALDAMSLMRTASKQGKDAMTKEFKELPEDVRDAVLKLHNEELQELGKQASQVKSG